MENKDLTYLFEDILSEGFGDPMPKTTKHVQERMAKGEKLSDIIKSKEYFEIRDEELGLKKKVLTESEENKIADVIDGIKDITYGFISKKDGSRIDDREWIHHCDDLPEYYETNWDPEITLKNKLGICVDQSLATKYLMNKYHPEIETKFYALYKGRFGHCVFTFKDDGKYYYLENAWDRERGLHGPFDFEDDLESYLNFIYYKNHYKDNDEPVIVREYFPQSITENYINLI